MSGELLINNLAGLLIITALMIIAARRPKVAACLYSLQSLVLVLTFIAIAASVQAEPLYEWAMTALVTKVIVLPLLLYRAFGKMQEAGDVRPGIHPGWLLLAGVATVLVSFKAVEGVELPLLAHLKPALAVSVGHFLLGVLCIISQRNILKQLFGYCLMENGASLTLALLANKAPGLVEIGVTTDAVFAVGFMVVLARHIYKKLHTLDARQLMQLKG